MKLEFSKYQGTGNDFIIVDNRDHSFPKEDPQVVKDLCDRKFGVGADGLILLEHDPKVDFHMIYYNADGTMSLCGNGSRCAIAFASPGGFGV